MNDLNNSLLKWEGYSDIQPLQSSMIKLRQLLTINFAVVTKEISQTPSCKSASQFVPTMFSRFWLHVILKYDYLFSLLRIFEGETLWPKIGCREKGLSWGMCVYKALWIWFVKNLGREKDFTENLLAEKYDYHDVCLDVNLFVFQRLINVSQLLSNMHRRYLNVNSMSNFANNNKTMNYKDRHFPSEYGAVCCW